MAIDLKLPLALDAEIPACAQTKDWFYQVQSCRKDYRLRRNRDLSHAVAEVCR